LYCEWIKYNQNGVTRGKRRAVAQETTEEKQGG
jgi:hypothetical protein